MLRSASLAGINAAALSSRISRPAAAGTYADRPSKVNVRFAAVGIMRSQLPRTSVSHQQCPQCRQSTRSRIWHFPKDHTGLEPPTATLIIQRLLDPLEAAPDPWKQDGSKWTSASCRAFRWTRRLRGARGVEGAEVLVGVSCSAVLSGRVKLTVKWPRPCPDRDAGAVAERARRIQTFRSSLGNHD